MPTKEGTMTTQDSCCTIVPYFKVEQGNQAKFRDLSKQLVEKARDEAGCLYYGYSYSGDLAFCREGYVDADALLAHLENVGALLQDVLKYCEIVRLEVHGPEDELAKLRAPLAELKPQFFTLEYGFRR
jgi:quinol monooxygenase YgiN